MRKVEKGFSCRIIDLFPSMLVQNLMGEGSAIPTDPQHTPTTLQPSSSQTKKTQKPRKSKIKNTQVPPPSGSIEHAADEAVYKELDDRLVRGATIATSLDAVQDNGNIDKTQSKLTPIESGSLRTTSGGGPRYQEAMGNTIAQTRFENVSKLSNELLLARAPQIRRMTKNLEEHGLMDVKSAFLYGKILEEVYVCQPLGFKDPYCSDRVYKVEKALYGLHPAPKAWYETLSTYLLDNGFHRGMIDKTFFIKGTKMSSIGELTFFFRLQVKKKEDGIFISQDKYVNEILNKFGFSDVKTVSTPMETHKTLLKDEKGEDVDKDLYRSMIGSFMYLTSSRPNIMFAVCACARFQVNPKISHLHDVKRIFRYLKGTAKVQNINREAQLHAKVDGKKVVIFEASIRRDLRFRDEGGIDCLPNKTIFEQLSLMGYEKLTQKLSFYKAYFSSQWKFLIHTILQCLSAKIIARNEFSSTIEFAVICLATDQKFNFSKYIFDSMVKNLDSATKFLMFPRFFQVFLDNQFEEMTNLTRIYVPRSHFKKIFRNMKRVGKGSFGKDTPLFPTMMVQAQEELGEDITIPTETLPTPIITQPLSSQPSRKQKPRKTRRHDTELPQTSVLTKTVVDKAVNEEMYDCLERATTTATSLDAEQDRGNISKTQSKATPNELSSSGTSLGGGPKRKDTMRDTIAQTKSENVFNFSNDPPLSRVNTLVSGEDRLTHKELMELCTKLFDKVLNLETIKIAQAKEILSLKRRVKRLEKKKRSRTHGLKRLYKVEVSARVESSADEENEDIFGVNDQDDTSMFNADKDLQAFVTTTTLTIYMDEITLAKALTKIKTSRPKAKRIVMQEPSETPTPTLIVSSQQPSKIEEVNLAWGDIQAKVDADYALAERLQAEEQEQLTDADTMADQRTMAELLHAPTEGYAEAIVVPPILVEHFELKYSLINMMTSDLRKTILMITSGQPIVGSKKNPRVLFSLGKILFPNSLMNSLPPQEQQIFVMKFLTFNNSLMNRFMRHGIITKISFVHALILVLPNCTNLILSTMPYDVPKEWIYYLEIQEPLPSNTIANPKGELKSTTTQSGLVLDGPSVPMPPPFINSEEDERVEETLMDQDLAEDPLHPNIPYPLRMHKQKQQNKDEIQIHKFWKMFKKLHISITLVDALILIPKYQKMLKALLFNKEKLLELANMPLNENFLVVILKKLPEKLGDPRKFSFRLPELISTRMTFELANWAICTPAKIARDVFVSVGKFTFPADFVIIDYESDPRVLLILGRPFLQTTRALIDGDIVLIEKLLNLDSTKDLPPPHNINPLSGSTTSSSPDHLLEEFANELAFITFPPGNDDLPFDIESDLREIKYFLNHDPTKEMDSILKDSIDECNLADPDENLFDTIPEMFTDEHSLDYSSPLIYNDFDDDLFEFESTIVDVYNDPFDSKGKKIKESKLLID
uniref:Reverse transcriptase Ty1/copia-type domain-containing protein n=1 Tax=Tanacetum cinerariifolium TaxID=118510 RepID=A0A6L2J0Q2_TANCI|nr:hypothetical protein [Tanacetum cinerariifolium]